MAYLLKGTPPNRSDPPLAHLKRPSPRRWTWTRMLVCVSAIALCSTAFVNQTYNPISLLSSVVHGATTNIQTFQECAIRNMLDTELYFLESVHPPTIKHFESRRNRLAQALIADGVDAFGLEPGYTFQYYANISQSEWEPWEPEERPFLMVVQPYHDHETGMITAKTSFLCPSFEAERARLLSMPFSEPIHIITWEEHWNPYKTLLESGNFTAERRRPRLMVDEEMRDYIQRGLGEIGFDVVGLQRNVEAVYIQGSPRKRSKLFLTLRFEQRDLNRFLTLYYLVWNIVFEAQSQSLKQLHANATAASVDIAARDVITSAGYGHAFTHRVGHGIGIKGMTFTSEPGVYLVDEFGVRHEDVLLVNGEDEDPILLTGRRAHGPWDP
ncbi:hypothetical protein UA08_06561 [Talaromyces atroroseus]|uniref:Peptidase M24 domain-containing protein n=1 Tax=Talaromyces atroroseus TaxID=1441469 RepID=A0A225ATL8_TALAT|nr:hypothetical protein UA08_06561 [Talaromyces atroroseus]OKL58276.1 hypothetical protein UA08_06561 [Talaromyces atroroseus]